MSDQSQGGVGGGDLHPAFNSPVTKPATPPPEYHQSGQPDRKRGYSPARDAREQRQHQPPASDGPQQQPSIPDKFSIDGVEWSADQVRAAISRQVEADARKASLPQDPRGYEIKLPADFQAPQGVSFEFDQNSPELQRFQQLAHARGIDQQTFSEMLGVYAATKIGESQQLTTARNAELAKLGSAATRRIDAIETWLKARVGSDANLIVSQMRNYPVASMVTAFEKIIGAFSNQGSASYSQSGRHQEDPSGKIPGYETMSYNQRRASQDAQQAGRR